MLHITDVTMLGESDCDVQEAGMMMGMPPGMGMMGMPPGMMGMGPGPGMMGGGPRPGMMGPPMPPGGVQSSHSP